MADYPTPEHDDRKHSSKWQELIENVWHYDWWQFNLLWMGLGSSLYFRLGMLSHCHHPERERLTRWRHRTVFIFWFHVSGLAAPASLFFDGAIWQDDMSRHSRNQRSWLNHIPPQNTTTDCGPGCGARFSKSSVPCGPGCWPTRWPGWGASRRRSGRRRGWRTRARRACRNVWQNS